MCTSKSNFMNDGRGVIFPASDGMQCPAYVGFLGVWGFFFSLQIRVLIIENLGLLILQNCLSPLVISAL